MAIIGCQEIRSAFPRCSAPIGVFVVQTADDGQDVDQYGGWLYDKAV